MGIYFVDYIGLLRYVNEKIYGKFFRVCSLIYVILDKVISILR